MYVRGLLWDQTGIDREEMSGARVELVLMRVYLRCCCSASSMQWMRHCLRWYSCRRRSHCCSPLNSAQSDGKHGHAYLAGWPRLRLPLHFAAGRRTKKSGGPPLRLMMRRHGTGGPASSAESLETNQQLELQSCWVKNVSPKKKEINLSNLLDGVMMNDVGSSAGLVVVLKGWHSGLLELLRYQLLCLQWRSSRWGGWRGTVSNWWGWLLNNTLLYFLLLLQCFDKCSFQPIGMLSF